MNKTIKYFFTFSAIFLFLASVHSASAAVMYILPETDHFSRGAEFSIDIKIGSDGENINAAQAAISWPTSVLEFVKVEKDGSVFNFWVDEPKLSSDLNSLSFIGGTAKGISGEALQVLKIKFKAGGSGVAEISLSEAAITASDGKGTNVLSKIKGASFSVGAEIVQPKAPAPKPESTPQPIRVERKAIPGEKLPQAPTISVPLYSGQTNWHNKLDELVVLWDVPNDVIEVATQLDHSPNTVPQKTEKELATGNKFRILEGGIWYIHARFRNNIGWGPVAHYRVAIDTNPPLAFEVTLPEGETTDNPEPILQFITSDALSGLKEYQVRIGDGDLIKIPVADFSGTFKLPLQSPGKQQIIVKAVDYADNSIKDDLTLEIIPIASPTITFVTRELFSNEEKGLTVKGTALQNVNMLIKVYKKEAIVADSTNQVDNRGNWGFTFDQAFKNGSYKVTAQSQDARGALSLVVESALVKVKSKPIIQIGVFQLGKGGVALLLLLILISGFSGGVWFYKKRQEKLAMRVSFTESEITKIFQLLKEDVGRLSKTIETPTTGDDEYALKRLEENIQKMEAYLKKGVEKIKR